MNCTNLDIDKLSIDTCPDELLLQEIRNGQWCGNCDNCLFVYIYLANYLSEEQLIEIFGADLLEQEAMKQALGRLAGLVLMPEPNRVRINRTHEIMRRIQNKMENKLLVKYYINECLRQVNDDLFEDYFNMSLDV